MNIKTKPFTPPQRDLLAMLIGNNSVLGESYESATAALLLAAYNSREPEIVEVFNA
jgi:hypothetical protein